MTSRTVNRGNVAWGGVMMVLGVLVCLAFLIFDSWILLAAWPYGVVTIFLGYALLSEGLGKQREAPEVRVSPVARQQPIPPETKREVWARDGGLCVLCGAKTDLRFGYVSQGSEGGNSPANLRVLCGSCERSLSTGIL